MENSGFTSGWIAANGDLYPSKRRLSQPGDPAVAQMLQMMCAVDDENWLDAGAVEVQADLVMFRKWPTDKQFTMLRENGLLGNTAMCRDTFAILNHKANLPAECMSSICFELFRPYNLGFCLVLQKFVPDVEKALVQHGQCSLVTDPPAGWPNHRRLVCSRPSNG